jgi:hypothetical protein
MMRGVGATQDALFEALARLRTAWPKRGWTWDGRLSCVASSFGVDLTSEARAAVGLAFPHEWNQRNLMRAGEVLNELAARAGGIRPDQAIFSTEAADGLTGYALWWPWGDEVTISLRVGLVGSAAVREEFRLRDTFNALD